MRDCAVPVGCCQVKYYRFTQRPGDCVFLPYSMLHYVNKTNVGFQSAASYMWLPTEKYDEGVCKDAPLRNLPMGAYDVLWHYNGSGVIPQGYPDPHKDILLRVQEEMREAGEEWFTAGTFDRWLKEGAECKHNAPLKKEMMDAVMRFAKVDPQKGLHISEMGWPNVPISEWLRIAAEGDPEGKLPCDTNIPYVTIAAGAAARSSISQW
jgi:hypothetical protein